MKHATIARNYAEALFQAAEARGRSEEWGGLVAAVAGAVAADERIALALDSPRVAKPEKARILEAALGDLAPREVVSFLKAVVRRGRQGLLGEIAQAYEDLVDVKLDRVHAGITLAAEPDRTFERQIIERLSTSIGKEVRAHVRADPRIVGGVVVRVGDRIYDGSVRRRLTALRRRMLAGE